MGQLWRIQVPTRGAGLGACHCAPTKPCAPKLPSSASVLAVIHGERGAWFKVVTSTVLRALLIAPGLYWSGVRGDSLVTSAALGSSGITAFLFVYYMALGAGSPNEQR